MTFPVWVEQQNGTFTASVVGSPHLRATGPTREKDVTREMLAEIYRYRDELKAREFPE